MIFGWVLDLVYAVVHPVLGLIPDAGSIGITGSATFFGMLRAADNVVAISGPLTFVAVLLAAVPFLLGFRFVVWAYRLIPAKFT